MIRRALFTFLMLLLGIDSYVSAQCELEDPLRFGVQVAAKIDDDGTILITRTNIVGICRPEKKTETRTKTVERDGKQLTVQETVEIDVMVCESKVSIEKRKVAANLVRAFDMAGKPIAADKLLASLQNETMVLFATRELSPFYLSVYKPDTILLVMKQHDFFSSPIEGQGGPIAIPANPGAPALPLPPGAPVLPPPPPALPAPPAIPAAKKETPTALLQPGAPSEEPEGIVGVSPFVVLAQSAGGNINLRQYIKETTTEKIVKTVDVDGAKKSVYMEIAVEKVNDVERKYPLGAVKIVRADKQAITPEQIAQQLSKTTSVLKSADGLEIPAQYLKIVRPEALIVIPAMTVPQYDVAAPVAMPAPRQIFPPAPAPVPAPAPARAVPRATILPATP